MTCIQLILLDLKHSITMNIWKIIFFCLPPYSCLFPQNGNVALLVKIMNIVFSSGKMRFVHNKTAVSHILERALILSNVTLNSFTVNYFSTAQLRSVISTEKQQAGSDTLIVVIDACDFLCPIFQPGFRKQIPDLFQSHSRMVFAYEKASVTSTKLLQRLVDEFAIDVFVVENLVLEETPHVYKIEPVEKVGLRVENLFSKKTILFVNKTSGATVVNWKDFECKKWSPKFASGTFFRISLFHCPPFWYVNNGTLERGLESLVLDEITKDWPVKYHVEEIDPEDDKWNYTLGLVEQRERDAAGCSQWLIRTANRRVELSYPAYPVCVTFLVKKPQLLPVSTFLFQSLQVSVYLAIFTVLLLVRVLLKVMKLSRWSSPRARQYDEESAKRPRALSTKSFNTLVLFWVLFCLLCSTYYSAGLTSNSAHPRVTHNINNLEKMAAYQVPWVFSFNYYQHYFRTLDNPTLRTLADSYIQGHKILNRTEYSAIYVKSFGTKYVSEIGELPLAEWKYYKLLDDCFGHYFAGFVLQENSPYVKIFSDVTQRLVESGLVSNMFDNLYTENRVFMNVFFSKYVDAVEYILIDLEKLQGALFLLVVGWVISFVIFILERLYSKRVQRTLSN